MNSRERANLAFRHIQPDRVPISLGAHICDSFTKQAKDDYERFFNMAITPAFITNVPMGSVATPENIAALFETDFRTVRLKAPGHDNTVFFEDGSYIDELGCRWKSCGYYYDIIERPLMGDITEKDIVNSQWPDPSDPGRIKGLKDEAKNLSENTDFAIVADFACGGPFETSLFVRGWEDFLSDLYLNPILAEALMDKVTEIDMQLWDVFLNAVGKYADVICFGDDLAMQDRPIISVDVYNKYIKKYHARLYEFVRSKTKAKVFQHCCGSAYDLIPGLIEAGVDILNPVQTSAKNMEPERLKDEFGKDIVFWGGLDVQKILPFGTPQQIEDEVKRLMDVLGRDGGYVFSPAHNIQPLVPAENIDTMYKSALKYRSSDRYLKGF